MKKGFTLIEVIGAVVILGLISLIAIPTLLNVVKNKEREMNEVTKQLVYTASSQYTTKYENIFKRIIGNDYCITVKDLVINNFLTEINTDDINLDTKIKVTIDNNKKYKYEIDNNCEPTQLEQEQLTISITTDPGIFNELDWAKEDFYVSIIGNGTSYKWCSTTDGECIPETTINNPSGSALIDVEGENVVCAKAINGTNESEIECSEVFKLDKTAPVIHFLAVTDDNVDSTNNVFNIPFTMTDDLSGVMKAIENDTTVLVMNELTNRYNASVDISSIVETGSESFILGYDKAGNASSYHIGVSNYVQPVYTESSNFESKTITYTSNAFIKLSLNASCPDGYSIISDNSSYSINGNEIVFTLKPNCKEEYEDWTTGGTCYIHAADWSESTYPSCSTESIYRCDNVNSGLDECYYCPIGYEYYAAREECAKVSTIYGYYYTISWYDYSIAKLN